MEIWDLQREGERQEILKTGGIVKEVKLKAMIPNPGIEARSPALQADSLLSEPPGKPPFTGNLHNYITCIFISINLAYEGTEVRGTSKWQGTAENQVYLMLNRHVLLIHFT